MYRTKKKRWNMKDNEHLQVADGSAEGEGTVALVTTHLDGTSGVLGVLVATQHPVSAKTD
jgi:hypothetical protein